MAEHKPQPIPEESLKQGYEVRDADLRVILWSGSTLAVVVVTVFMVIGLFYWFLNVQSTERAGSPPPLLEEAQGLQPRLLLQRNPVEDMREMRRDTNVILNSYGWVDKRAGVVRIPITEAMKLTLERGLPTQPKK